jgi:hypothetical protein
MSLDSIIDIDIALSSPSVSRAGFGTPMLLASGLGAGFTERIRFYSSATEVAADSDLSASAQARATLMLAQALRPDRIAVGRREAAVAQVDTLVVTAAADGVYTVTINGIDFAFTATSSTVTAIRDALLAAINLGSEPVTAASVSTNTLTLTADVAGVPFLVSIVSVSPITLSTTVANVGVTSEILAVEAESSAWYGLVLESRDDTDILLAAGQIEAMQKVFIAQSNSADLITVATTDIASQIKALSYRRTHVAYISSDTNHYDAALAASFLSSDFDETAPTATHLILQGVTSEELGTTAQANLEAKNAGFYSTLFGLPAVANCLTAAGYDLELIVTVDWVKARMSEAVAQLFSNRANGRKRIGFDDIGFQMVAAEAEGAALVGEDVGHFIKGTVVFEVPARADVATADEAISKLRMRFGAQYSGRTKSVSVQGYVSQSFAGL